MVLFRKMKGIAFILFILLTCPLLTWQLDYGGGEFDGCELLTCLNGGECIGNFNEENAKCRCVRQYYGTNCSGEAAEYMVVVQHFVLPSLLDNEEIALMYLSELSRALNLTGEHFYISYVGPRRYHVLNQRMELMDRSVEVEFYMLRFKEDLFVLKDRYYKLGTGNFSDLFKDGLVSTGILCPNNLLAMDCNVAGNFAHSRSSMYQLILFLLIGLVF